MKNLLYILVLLWITPIQAQEYGGGSFEVFVLDEDDDSSRNITLQFGSTLNKFLEWDVTNNRFNLNDTLRVFGNVEQDGNVLTLDADNGGEGADVDIVANQGSDNAGRIRYNATDNQWELSNDGASFEPISTGGGTNITQLTASINNGAEEIFTHNTDPNYERVVDVYYQDAETIDDRNSWDVLTSEEGLYTQEDNNITDFSGDTIKLQPAGSYTPGSTNLSIGATALASDTTRAPSEGNDNSTSTFWYNQGESSSANQWWAVDLGSPTTVMRAQINWYSTSYHATTMRIEGSNDGSNWTTVSTVNPVGGDTTDETWDFTPATFRYWRFFCVTGQNATYFVIREGRFFEALGGGYSATPAYVTTRPGKSLVTSPWSQINSVDVVENQPASTELRYLFSFDDGVTWKSFNGSAWGTQTLSDIETVGMTSAQVESLSAANWNVSGGLNSGTGNLDYAVSIGTSDTNNTPVHSGISFNYSTQTYWQKTNQSTARVRLHSDTTIGVQNLTGGTKTFKVNIMQP